MGDLPTMNMLNETDETEILSQIKISEKKAEEVVEKANILKDSMIQDAIKDSAEILINKKEELRILQEKKVLNSKEKAITLKNEKIIENKKTVNQIRKKTEKNINKAVQFIMDKFGKSI